MPPSDREMIVALAERVQELEARLAPQALRNAQEHTFSPRGLADEVRLQDSTGGLLPFRRTFQMPSFTLADDPANERTVITGGGGSLEGVFSEDDTPGDGERLLFVDAVDDTIRRLEVATRTDLSDRVMDMKLEEDIGANTFPRFRLRAAVAKSTSSSSGDVLLEMSNGGSRLANTAWSTSSGTSRVTSTAGIGTSTATLQLSSSSSSQTASITAGTRQRVLLDRNGGSGFMQLERLSVPGAAVQRVMRGYFSANPGAIAAGGAVTVNVANVLDSGAAAANHVIVGHIRGASGTGAVQWSWLPAAGESVDIHFVNPTAASITPLLQFFAISDA